MNITKAINQTKNWRQIQPWWKGGKKSECEIYQRGIVETITGSKCHKTNTRIHLFRKELVEMTCPRMGLSILKTLTGSKYVLIIRRYIITLR